ncbi:VanW family protein [Virgibacillus kekensis]|uniref:VanW family protein n=1 Tax=Virgibacillus kekensis TaxID=202261 RepID=A0ABV9DDQ8_9BACI
MITVILSFLLAANPFIITDEDEVIEKLSQEDFMMSYLDSPFINNQKLELQMEVLTEKIYKDPINARLADNGRIIKEKPGLTLDRLKFKKQFYDYFYNGEDRAVEVPKRKIYPRVDSELISEIREKELGSYVTYFKSGNKERTHNISLAAEAIDNHVVFPGETFSFNKVVGKRTKERGYKRAPVIVRGELSEDYGGGICQVSSTLFNAVELRGIKIVERYSHSRSVPYVPPGRDATVSWYGPDFVFKNKYNQPILIRAFAKNGQMVIKILSSDSL